MRLKVSKWFSCLSLGLTVVGNSVFASTPSHQEQVQVPQCLASKITSHYSVLAENDQFKIIELPSSDLDSLTLLADRTKCGHFVNLSHKIDGASLLARQQSASSLLKQKSAFPRRPAVNYEIKHKAEVNAAIALIEPENIWQTLAHLTSYNNRSATKESGVAAAKWIKATFDKMAVQSGHDDTDSFFVNTGWYKQPSVVTVIGKDIKAPAIVIGAHMDTLDGRMPGAGDDASGSSTIMEMAQVLLQAKLPFKRPVYIIWYSAEERGLVGSQYVVEYFQNHNIPVQAAVQFDMTGYRVKAEDPTMWVFTDYTDKGLSNYVAQLIDIYVNVPVDYSQCGYGCSDHASWTEAGVPSAFPCESNFEDHNPYIHTSSDVVALLSLDHMVNFTKLALAFAIELASE